MAWLDGYRKRALMNVRTTAAPANGYIEFDPPESWDDFWDTIDTDGYGIRVCQSDGYDLSTYEWTTATGGSAFNKANRTGTLVFGSAAATYTTNQDEPRVYWLYYDPESAATDGSSTPPTTGDNYAADVIRARPAAPLILAGRESPGAATPSQVVGKMSAEEVRIIWDLTGVLNEAFGVAFGVSERVSWEEVKELSFDVQLAAASQSAMVGLSENGLSHFDGRTYATTVVKAGTSGVIYTAILSITTSVPTSGQAVRQTLEYRCLVKVQDPDET